MPEIAEVARIVHFLRLHLVSKTLSRVLVQEDNNVYGKAGATSAHFQTAMTGKTVVGAGQQGKYFWLVMSSPPHPVMHFGMTGWMKIRGQETYYYREKSEDTEEEWPPKYWKFILEAKGEGEERCEVAFVDARRFSRIKLLDCAGDDIRTVSPLKENGPDPIIDKDILTAEWLTNKLKRIKKPVKAFLLDQANISGIGNWVGDEILYHAKIHPEQHSNTLTSAQVHQLHTSILHITSTAVDLLGDSERFPDDWIFKHRWGKGKKDHPKTLPNGQKIVHITVGGRTSAVVPSVQKKTRPTAGDVKEEGLEDDQVAGGKAGRKGSKKRKVQQEEVEEAEEEEEEEEGRGGDGEEKRNLPAKITRRGRPKKPTPDTKQESSNLLSRNYEAPPARKKRSGRSPVILSGADIRRLKAEGKSLEDAFMGR
ncbi:MAG: hypothetical protein M1834_008117 [Cirrosporium novae-zelandiae]|nr:MAG: hypothetical protein M1834_008117 [Cirrosporium novae-zelandiae]